jgi:hypothetical protein
MRRALHVLGASGPKGSAYAAEVLADSPIAYWRMDETSGTTMVDSSGNGRDGTYSNTPTLGATSLLPANGGTAVGFNGSDEYATVAHNSALNGSGAFTFEAWLKVDNPTADALYVIADKTAVGSSNAQWSVWYDNRVSRGSPKRLAFFCANSTAQLDWNDCATQVAAGGHVVCTVNGPGAAQTVKMYWNGSEVAVRTNANFGWSATTLAVSIARLGSGAFYLGGTLDEVALYSTALSSTRVLAHYNAA